MHVTETHSLSCNDEAFASSDQQLAIYKEESTNSCSGSSESGGICLDEQIEHISWNDQLLACIIRASFKSDHTAFITPPEFKQQVGFVVYPKGGEISRHVHRQLERHLVGTSEVLVVRSGRCEIDVYSDERKLVATRELCPGDIIVMVAGGHGFRMVEDTVLLEVKQGPYTGVDEKEWF